MSQVNEDNLIWIDLEMTGLDTDNDSSSKSPPSSPTKTWSFWPKVRCSPSATRRSGWKRWIPGTATSTAVRACGNRWSAPATDHAQAEQATLDFLKQWVIPGKSPMCGNSICQDRRFLHRQMPQLERFFHYRNLDVSTLKELARRWAPLIGRGFNKESAHTALSDIRDSIEELRYYRQFMGPLGGSE